MSSTDDQPTAGTRAARHHAVAKSSMQAAALALDVQDYADALAWIDRAGASITEILERKNAE